MVARQSAPVLGGEQSPYLSPGGWESTLSYRYQYSFRHFTGDHEDKGRVDEHTNVRNTIHLFDLAITRGLSKRFSVSLGIPFIIADRSGPVRTEDRSSILDRYEVQTQGIGDVSLVGRGWIFDPDSHPWGNVSLGVGIKVPTGDPGVEDTQKRNPRDGVDQVVTEIRTVDQSIQPGDGGWGVPVSLRAFQSFREGSTGAYLSGTYLINPEGTNGVQTGRSRRSEAVMSVADQFVASAGIWYAPTFVPGLALRLGGRAEGVPSYDLIGSSKGFRRPGISIAVEIGVSYAWENWSVGASLPFTQIGNARIGYRNRWKSVSDKEDDRHGDAAFADWLLLLSVTHRF